MLLSMFMVIHALFHVHGGLLFDMFTVVVLHSMRCRGLFSHVLGCHEFMMFSCWRHAWVMSMHGLHAWASRPHETSVVALQFFITCSIAFN